MDNREQMGNKDQAFENYFFSKSAHSALEWKGSIQVIPTPWLGGGRHRHTDKGVPCGAVRLVVPTAARVRPGIDLNKSEQMVVKNH
jgi:hypothetical protein